MPSDRRSRKRLATRDDISEAATRLFYERGFDNVTVDEIAEEADVGRMTVFNHFPRKEDMFFDRIEEANNILRDAVRQREPEVTPIDALHLLVQRLVAEESPYVEFSAQTLHFGETIEASETLKSRARAIRDEFAQVLAVALAEAVGREASDPAAHLAANFLVVTMTVAVIEAQRISRQTGDLAAAKTAFLALIQQGITGVKAAMAGTPYA